MLAYAAKTRSTAGRTGSPKALLLIVAGHAVLIGAVMATKMEMVSGKLDPTKLIDIYTPPPPPPPPVPETKPQTQPQRPEIQDSSIDQTTKLVDMGLTGTTELDKGPTIGELLTEIGKGTSTIIVDPPKHVPVRVAAVSRTPTDAIRPPYPNDKLRMEQEATLKLRLTIDARGRVTAVDAVNPADPSFLEAARRHIIRSWRYKPATEDGVAVPTTTVINLSFRLEEA